MLKLVFLLAFIASLDRSQGESQRRRGMVAQNGDVPPGALGTVVEWESSDGNTSDLSAILDMNDNTFIQSPISQQGFRTKYLLVQDFRFNISQGARIDRIRLEIKRSKDGGADAEDRALYLTYKNVLSTDRKNGNEFSTSITTIRYDYTPQEWGFSNISVSDIMDASFGIQYAVDGGICICSGYFYLHDVAITVDYTDIITLINTTGTTDITDTPVPTTTARNSSSSDNGDQTGFIIGVILGILLLFLFGFLWIWFLLNQRKKKLQAFETKLTESNISDHLLFINDQIEGARIKYRIGGGNFGEVYKGEWSGCSVALKKLKDSSQYAEFEQEWKILKSVNHPNIVRFYGIFISPEKEYFLVMEYVECGSLDQFLISERDKISPTDLLAITHQIIMGMKHLQEKGIIHRDLGSRNLLLSKELRNQRQVYIIKIADFGMSRQQNIYSSTNDKMPVKWTAPEALRFSKFSVKSDAWSFGIVLWEVFSFGEVPYSAFSNQEVIAKVVSGYRLPPPMNCPPFVSDLMSQCWKEEPNDRPDFFQIQAIFEENWKIVLNEGSEMNSESAIPENLSDFYNI